MERNRGSVTVTYDAYNIKAMLSIVTEDDRFVRRLNLTVHLPRDCSHFRTYILTDFPGQLIILHDRETTGAHADIEVMTADAEGNDKTGEIIHVITSAGRDSMMTGYLERISLLSI